ncbi:hypothetical protein [uncultured Polaribacter sp.]|jgi:hypothetical protein|uniref:hypothetical protein n=1 Tax=uncultured Polaribacter sp. TaxID=174711 RepID=UPI00261D6641|nr:hypothetical protein [uncultured Polaribacter sp.]
MAVFEFLLEIIGRIFVKFIFEGIIKGVFKMLKKLIEFIRVNIFGFKAKPIKPEEILEKKILYKKIELTENLNDKLKIGQKGDVLEIINKDKVFAEFYDSKGKQIEYRNKLVFEVGIKQFKLKK